jgi:hypothetical protein
MFGKEKSSLHQCAALESKLIEYLDGRARPVERHAVEEHLSGCASCRLRAEEFRAVWSALAAEPARRGFWDWMPTPRLALAVTALVVMSVWLSSRPRVATNPSVVSQASPSSQVSAESDFGMIRDLPVLENFDVVSKFDALSELPVAQAASRGEVIKETR